MLETLVLPRFSGPGQPRFEAPGGLAAQLPDASDFKAQIQTLARQPGLAYLDGLTQRADVNWQAVKLAHDQWNYEQEGLTGAGAALLAVVVAWATAGLGAGANLIGATEGTTAALMADAAFTSLASQAAISFVNNKGDLGKTLKDLGRSETVKATLAAMLTAGALSQIDGLDSVKDLKSSTAFGDQLTYNLINAGGRALTHTAIEGGDLEDALRQAILGAAVDTLHGEAASKIKGLEADYLAHKLAHALAGCVAGAAANGDCRDGAIGAAVGEVVAELMPPANGIAYSESEKDNVLALSKLVAGATSAYAGGDAQTAITTAETAVRNNALIPVIVGLAWLADKAWTAYEVSQDLAAIRDGVKTVAQVAQEKDEDYVTGIILGNIGRYGVKAAKVSGIWVQGKISHGVDWNPNISIRGGSWETHLGQGKFSPANGYDNLNETQPNHKTFDYFNPETGHAVSAKSMDTLALTREGGAPMTAESAARYLRRYIDDAAKYKKSDYQPSAIREDMVSSRTVELAIPHGTPANVRQALEAAAFDGRAKGVEVKITIVAAR